MQTVRGLLDTKGREVWSVNPDDSVYSALERMAEKNIGALLVCEDDRVVGIFSERDYARKVVLHGLVSRDVPVHQVMTTDVITVAPAHTLEECMALMTNRHDRHLPVLEEDRLVGVISIGDVVKAVISEQQFVIDEMTNYISGSRSKTGQQ